jgi:mono/diheme cytochrome c family protein
MRIAWGFLLWPALAPAQPPAPEAIQFFEAKVRPLLHQNCVGCHSDQKLTSGLSLESREAILKGGNRGPAAEPHQPDHSRILEAVLQTGPLKMPPTGKLKPDQIEILRHWIAAGLPWPAARPPSAEARRAATNHWSFQPPQRAAEPAVRDAAWPRNPIDRFILARLEQEGLKPSPEADRVTLLRRLSLDLIGLPPTPAEVDAFLADRSPDAYEKVVDRLLASPHYGERWGRHWLDAARYADTNGFGFDNPRVMWRWRDWVIDALNRDMPFDQFTIEQIAGDLLPNATLEQKIATGFHRNTMINQEGGVDQEQYRIEAVFDRVATTGTVWLGLTLGCTQCHDHKYDPISQREFYQLFAFYNNQDETTIKVVPPAEVDRYRRVSADYEVERLKLQTELARYNAGLLDQLAKWEADLTPDARAKLPGNLQEVLKIPPSKRDLNQAEDIEKYWKEVDPVWQQLRRNLELLTATPNNRNPNQYTAMVLEEREKPRKSHVLIGGDFLRPGVEVQPGMPAVLPPLPKEDASPNRLTLARWLVSPENPLTARVTVNRIWQQYFGRGLVRTSEDFGTQGDRPTHPELLDWLAAEFLGRQWSLKAMHRLIVTSAIYRQTSRVTPELLERDPENLLLARFPRLRVEAEIVRDIVLSAAGLLDRRVGGPSVFPPQPPGVTDLSRGNLIWVTATGPDRFRRGFYTFWKRTSPYPTFTTFDMASAETTVVRRTRSNTPLQALTTLNDEVFVEAAQGLARRVLREAPADDAARLRYGFRLCVAREPDGVERDTLLTFLRKEPDPDKAWLNVARVLLNLDETITRE